MHLWNKRIPKGKFWWIPSLEKIILMGPNDMLEMGQ